MKKALIIASCLVVAGILVCFIAALLVGFDFRKLDNNMYITNTYEFTEEINNVYIDCTTADIEISPAEDNIAKVICSERDNRKHLVKLTDGTLKIEKENKEWYKNIDFFSFRNPKITLYLPQKDYSSLKINCSTGDIDVRDFKFTTLNIDTTTGYVNLNNIISTDLNAKATTGDIKLNKVITTNANFKASTGDVRLINTNAYNHIEIKVTTGDVTFENSDAQTIKCKTTTGNISGNFLTKKVFYTEVTTGKVFVPHSTEGGLCELKTTTGDIKISVNEY